ncbi:uncharacterized protein N7496_007767 [Penicillium cataractarum]|uniref:Uncharacterized protein n=1 Tax=Penicillium cataractarum TaxID=2100454 RepID=A0A9W9V448_9EURO|nr:uncharacterized protein N7496_007767 [Penicillium cataractarum]KAJ5368007.1 hypothetical protein N7496_007767 [Penicillium cataractarum]
MTSTTWHARIKRPPKILKCLYLHFTNPNRITQQISTNKISLQFHMSRIPIQMTLDTTAPNLNSDHLNRKGEDIRALLVALTLWIPPEKESLFTELALDAIQAVDTAVVRSIINDFEEILAYGGGRDLLTLKSVVNCG